MSYRFLVNDTPATDWQPENQWTWTAIEPGTSQILVQVKDSLHEGAQGDGGNMSREFSIIAPAPVQEPVQTEVVPAEVVPAKLNESPVITGLTTESVSPQLLGTSVTWTAQASDPESDQISYRFLVNGTPATDWQAENLWTWTAIEPGTSQILVQVKDSLHEGAQGVAGNMSAEFTINAPAPVKCLPKPGVPAESYRRSSTNRRSCGLTATAKAHSDWEQQSPGRPRPAIRNPIQFHIASWSTARLPPTGNQRTCGLGRP